MRVTSFAAWVTCAARSSAGWILMIAASSAGPCLGAGPNVAKGLIQVFQVDSSGGEHLVNSIQLLEARNRLGSCYSLQEDDNGRRASLGNSSTGLMYSLDSRAKKAMAIGKMFQYMEGGRAAPQAADPGSQSSHLNIPCVRFPVRQSMPGKLATIGESCVSPGLELVLRSEGKMEVDGKTVIVRRAMTDVRKGEEPDASWFRIPQDYTVTGQPPRKR